MVTYYEEATNQVFDYEWCRDQLRSGHRPIITKSTPHGDLICKLVGDDDGCVVAEVCTEWMAPEVSADLNMLVQTAYVTNLRLVILLYPQGNFNITFRQPDTFEYQFSTES